MTVKNIFVYKLFLLLNILDFRLFLCKNCNPPEKVHPLFPNNTFSKSRPCQAPLLLEIWYEGQPSPLPAKRGGEGAHYVSANDGVHLDQILS